MVEDKTKEDKITEDIELLTELMRVKSSIKKNVTEDYTLATLTSAEREFITENYENAEFAKELIERFGVKGYEYQYDEVKGDWKRDKDGMPEKVHIDKEEMVKINMYGERIFTFFMIKPHLIAILNRNKVDNFLVKLLGKDKDEEKPVIYNEDDRSMLKKAIDKLKGNDGGEDDTE